MYTTATRFGFDPDTCRRVPFGLSSRSKTSRGAQLDVFMLLELEAVLPDGCIVRAPSADPLPPSRQFSEYFGADRTVLEVFLAIVETSSLICLSLSGPI